MWFIERLLFESTLYWGVFSFILFAIVLLTRTRSTGAYRRYSLPGVFGLIVLLFFLQKAITTQREHILASLDEFITGITQENKAEIEKAFSQDYDAEDYDHEEMVSAVMRALAVVDIFDVRYRKREIAFDGDSADMTFGVMATVRAEGAPATIHAGRWRIGWKREPTRWRIVSIRPEMIDGVPLTRMHSLLRHYH